jgi:hypothetical protein
MLDIDTAIKTINRYHETTIKGNNTRYRSWVHCYKAFHDNWDKANNQETIDYLSLHLAFYLASWGMLRGSAGLLQRDYKVHESVVKKLTDTKYERLFAVNQTRDTIELVMEADKEIEGVYDSGISMTNTLRTKILLGIFGCAPAYDRYFMSAVRKYNICSSQWNKNSLLELWSYYEKYKRQFDEFRYKSIIEGITYPPMKVIDMCMWQTGIDLEN